MKNPALTDTTVTDTVTGTDADIDAAAPAPQEGPVLPAPVATENALSLPLETGYVTFAGPGEGGEFQDNDGGYRIHLVRGIPVKFGGKARLTAAYAQKLVEAGHAQYTTKDTDVPIQ